MSIVKRRLVTVLLALAVVIAFTPLLPGSASHALSLEHGDGMDPSEVVFDNYNDASNNDVGHLSSADSSVKIVKATSDKSSVASVSLFDGASNYVTVKPMGVGNTTIHITGDDNDTVDVPVEVTKSFMKGMIDSDTDLYDYHYGSPKLTLYTYAGATGSIKIGGKTYKIKKITSKKADKVVKRTIKLKKPSKIKLKSKVVMTINYGGASYKETVKVFSASVFDEVKGSKKKIKVKFYNIHKGDKVKVKYKGKTYTKKIKKNYDTKYKNITFKVKKKVSKTASMTITIVNKDKKTLCKEKIKLNNGEFWWPDEYEADEDDYSDDY